MSWFFACSWLNVCQTVNNICQYNQESYTIRSAICVTTTHSRMLLAFPHDHLQIWVQRPVYIYIVVHTSIKWHIPNKRFSDLRLATYEALKSVTELLRKLWEVWLWCCLPFYCTFKTTNFKSSKWLGKVFELRNLKFPVNDLTFGTGAIANYIWKFWIKFYSWIQNFKYFCQDQPYSVKSYYETSAMKNNRLWVWPVWCYVFIQNQSEQSKELLSLKEKLWI